MISPQELHSFRGSTKVTESVLEEQNIFTPKSPSKLNKWADATIQPQEVKPDQSPIFGSKNRPYSIQGSTRSTRLASSLRGEKFRLSPLGFRISSRDVTPFGLSSQIEQNKFLSKTQGPEIIRSRFNGTTKGGVTFYNKKPRVPRRNAKTNLGPIIDPFPKSPGYKVKLQDLGCIEPVTKPLDGIQRYQFPDPKPETPPHRYYKRYKMWEFEMIKLKNSKDFYNQISNIAADKMRKRMESYSPSLLQKHTRKEEQNIESADQETIQIVRTLTTDSQNSSPEQSSELMAKYRRVTIKPSFLTNPTSPLERTLPDGILHRTQIDHKLTDTNNYMPQRSVYHYLKTNFIDNILPPALIDPSILTRKDQIHRQKEQAKVERQIMSDNENYEQGQNLLEPIKEYKTTRPPYKYESLSKKFYKMQEEYQAKLLKLARYKAMKKRSSRNQRYSAGVKGIPEGQNFFSNLENL